jgi:alkanesulfonate monooxygenase SsuD/methylene tetrahydromethanopterin reductase-like flavin-dependent oxidoreductase (luciferase family)
LIGFRPNEELAARIRLYRSVREELGMTGEQIREEIGRIGVLRRVYVADSDEQALADVVPPLIWYSATGARVHRRNGASSLDPRTGARTIVAAPQAGSLPDGSTAPAAPPSADDVLRQSEGGMIAGSPKTVLNKLRDLQGLGVGHVIAWMSFGNMPYDKVQRSMALLASEVLPSLKGAQSPAN